MEQWSFPIFTFDEAIQHYRNGKKITRRTFQCPMCGASKRYADIYLA